jgi:hypothetical protein
VTLDLRGRGLDLPEGAYARLLGCPAPDGDIQVEDVDDGEDLEDMAFP